MGINPILRALVAALPLAAIALPALAEINDYEFQLTQSEFKQGDGVVITVKLIDKRSGKPVPDAVIFAKRIDMEPEGMATMAAPIEVLPAPEAGAYSFKTNLVMEGGWRLSLAAKVQGETGTLANKLVLKALP
ncbi:YtkA-like [Bosea sp. CRIB-10]|uniref:FixH family protein n=1 Tax=Bosea sp. CRIB-10 TaxID=378404 RepID=UPI0008E31F6F|nr:FixH family protein [Bosea sp. CRIB-10]SFC81942.1 YtkA-like [Bosea sp. CRIB-10]